MPEPDGGRCAGYNQQRTFARRRAMTRVKTSLPSRQNAARQEPTAKIVANGKSHNGHGVVPALRTMPMGKFLFDYLHSVGVKHSFGVLGDFALPTFAWLDKSPIQHITMTHEPGAGFAADAYARINGIG